MYSRIESKSSAPGDSMYQYDTAHIGKTRIPEQNIHENMFPASPSKIDVREPAVSLKSRESTCRRMRNAREQLNLVSICTISKKKECRIHFN